ncbi:MAG: PilZ domain-containing protein [Gammaproteobacteria bacterium]
MASVNDKRRHPRLVHHAQVRVVFPDGHSEQLKMHDFSEAGMFIQVQKPNLPAIDDLIQVQTLEIQDAPVLNARVARVVSGQGFAVKFI